MLKIDQDTCGMAVLKGIGTSRKRFEKTMESWRSRLAGENVHVDWRGTFSLAPDGQLDVCLVFWGLNVQVPALRMLAEMAKATLEAYDSAQCWKVHDWLEGDEDDRDPFAGDDGCARAVPGLRPFPN